MGSVERDPSGLLERVPELGRLAESHRSLKAAIEQGRPHAVYRALFWIRLTGKAGADAELIQHLLSTRRLFLTPLNGAPAMLTYNGIGSRPYGNSEPDPQDGSYLMTLYLVLLFVPVYPFSAYLVRPAAKGWTFFGKVPLSAVGYFWQRGMALAGLVAVLIGGLNAVGAMRYNTVQLVNALPTPVQVTVGQAQAVTVLSGQVEKVRTKVGTHEVVVKLAGQVLERGTLEVRRGYDVNAWNVLGAGALYREDVVYTAKGESGPANPEEPELLCGERTVLRDGIDFVFTTPPSEMSMGEHEKETRRSHFGLAEVSPTFCVFKLASAGKQAQAKALAQAVAAASDYNPEMVAKLVTLLAVRNDAKGALELADVARKKREGIIELQRLYQDRMLADGQREALLKEYEERARQTPDSADAAYLFGRLLSGKAGDSYVTASQARFPRHPYILRSAAYRALGRNEYGEVERLVDALRPIDAKLWQASLDLELRALAASSKVNKARGLVSDSLSRSDIDPAERFETVVDGLLLTRFEPKFAEEPLVEALHDENSVKTRELRLTARVNGCAPVSADELEAINDKDLKSRLDLELKTRKDPNAALAQVLSGDDSSPGITAAAWALLVAEAVRLDEHHPALLRLAHWAPVGDSGVAAFTRYVRQGTWNDELEDLPPDVLAAADFVRSRLATVPAERLALRDKATREDMLHGVVSTAMNEWPQ